jgi:hypothetical protein
MDTALAGKVAQDADLERRVEALERRIRGLMGVGAVVGVVVGGVWVWGLWRGRSKGGKGVGRKREWRGREE